MIFIIFWAITKRFSFLHSPKLMYAYLLWYCIFEYKCQVLHKCFSPSYSSCASQWSERLNFWGSLWVVGFDPIMNLRFWSYLTTVKHMKTLKLSEKRLVCKHMWSSWRMYSYFYEPLVTRLTTLVYDRERQEVRRRHHHRNTFVLPHLKLQLVPQHSVAATSYRTYFLLFLADSSSRHHDWPIH